MGSWYPIFRHNHHGSPAASSQLPDTIMPGERAAHPAPTLVMKDPGRLGVQYGWCHSKRPELPAMSRAIVLQCFFFGSWSWSGVKWQELPIVIWVCLKIRYPLNPVKIFTQKIVISFKSNRNQWVSWIFRSKSLFAKQPYFFCPFWFSHVRDLQSIVDPGTFSESISNRLSLVKSSRWRIFGNFKVD